MMEGDKQMKLLNLGSYITRCDSMKKPFTIGKALKMLENLGC